jgi:hypothetical protein
MPAMLRYDFGSHALRSIVFYIIALPSLTIAQIVNGSFEIDGQPSLAGWNFSCHGHTTVQDSPFDSTGYCLKLEAGNFQGCFPGFAYQILPDVKNGDVWKLEGWVKKLQYYPIPGIGFLKLGGPTGFTTLNTKNPTTDQWEYLSVQDTFDIGDQDTILVVLGAGSTSGPATGWSYFDLISVSRVLVTGINHDYLVENKPSRFTLQQNYPNPFNPATTIRFKTPVKTLVMLKVYDILGQELETLFNDETEAGEYSAQWNAERFSGGVYIYALTTNGYTERKRMVLIR